MSPRIYADHAATTPVRDEVIAAMLPYFGSVGFNASSLHAEGRAARAALDSARVSVARVLGAAPREIVFTGGGSEADNLALVGAARASSGPRRIVTSAIEHPAVAAAADVLRGEGFEIVLLGVDRDGRVDSAAFAAAIAPGAAVASIMLANNEIGVLEPIAELAALARARGVVFHTDAIQAPGRVPIGIGGLGVDLLSLSAHKFYGPKGVGALYVRAGTRLAPLVVGGGQEAGLRAGTENVAGIVGFARALELAVEDLPVEAPRLRRLRDAFEAEVVSRLPDCEVHAVAAPRLPNVSSIAIRGVDAPALLVRLDLDGVAVSAGSACAAGSTEPSHVIVALGKPAWAAVGTIRFSFGRLTSEQDVERLAKMLPGAVAAVRVGGTDLGTEHCDLAMGRAEGRFLTLSTDWWTVTWSVGIGVGVFLTGLGIFVLCLRTGGLIARLGKTLDEIDKQIPALSTPIATTLTHVGGIADTADSTIARLGVAVGQLENVAANATKTANTVGTLVSTFASNVRKGKTDPSGEPV